MQLLIKNVTILHPFSSFDEQITDILIENGIFTKIEKNIDTANAQIVDATNAFVSVGFLDIGAQCGDPGFEHREDVFSAANAAAFGGFTGVAVFPNTEPTLHSKTEILYIKNKTRDNIVDFFPIGALSHGCKGENIAELYDMHEAGAVAFSDGAKTIKDSGLMLRALEYVKAFGGKIMNHPMEKNVAQGGQMHEGTMSLSLGMKGIPSLAEEMMLVRDLYLLEYADSQLHIYNISTKNSVELVRKAKAKGLRVTASVAAINLVFEDEALEDFNTFLKVIPPLRAASDIKALKKGLQDGTIDSINSNHTPLDEEEWNLEFPYASFGAIGLETATAAANTHGDLTAAQLVAKFAIAPRQILQLPMPIIEVGAVANISIFDPTRTWTYGEQMIFSKSKNTPFVGKKFKGKTLAIVNNGEVRCFE